LGVFWPENEWLAQILATLGSELYNIGVMVMIFERTGSTLQASVSPDVLGRIYATRQMLANLSFMLAGVGFAWLADQIHVRWVYLIGGCLYLGTALYTVSSVAIRRSRIEAPVGVPVR
jgi:MFS family permease